MNIFQSNFKKFCTSTGAKKTQTAIITFETTVSYFNRDLQIAMRDEDSLK